MFNRRYWLIGMLLGGLVASANAQIRLSSPHQPVIETQRNELVRSCIDAVRDHWDGAGLVFKHQARHGYTTTGERVISVSGTVWRDGERVEVFHQCSQQPGSSKLALYTERETVIAKVNHENDN